MDCIERFLNDVAVKLTMKFNASDTNMILDICRKELVNYEISQPTTSLISYDDSNMRYLDIFLKIKKLEGRSMKTIYRYQDELSKLLSMYPNKRITEITANDLRLFLMQYSNRNCSNTTVNNVRKILCSFFNWLSDEDYIGKSPARKLPPIKEDTQPEPVYTEGDVEALKCNAKCIRDKLLIEFLYSTGCRIGEAEKIKMTDINPITRTVILHGKGNKDRTVALNTRIMYYLREYEEYKIKNNTISDYLFVSNRKPYTGLKAATLRGIIKDCGVVSKVSHAHPHRFRSTAATTAVNRGMSIQDVQIVLGHSSVQTTEHYLRRNPEHVINRFASVI